jgi:hypothetical protein
MADQRLYRTSSATGNDASMPPKHQRQPYALDASMLASQTVPELAASSIAGSISMSLAYCQRP